MPVFLELMAWQIVLVGAWMASRRMRQMERRLARSYRPPCYDQVGALREEVACLREDESAEGRDYGERLRELEITARRIDGQLHLVSSKLDDLTSATAQLLLEPHRRSPRRSARAG